MGPVPARALRRIVSLRMEENARYARLSGPADGGEEKNTRSEEIAREKNRA